MEVISMKLNVSKLSKLSGVSVRTLHYYDSIDLLKPSEVSQAGYRYYKDKEILRLQKILLYRELDFSLKDIADILSHSEHNKDEALAKQRKLLMLKADRINRLVSLIDDTLKGGNNMTFDAFDNEDYEKKKDEYAKEAKEKYGQTKAYAEYENKAKKRSKKEEADIAKRFDALMAKFSQYIGGDIEDAKLMLLVKEYQQFISDNYYQCTDEIFKNLAVMYVEDERFNKNIDKHGQGTAKLMHDAILNYLSVS